jgi:two-component system response regulator TtrR
VSGPAPKVFVVDDDEAMRDSLRWLLESRGFAVVEFDSAEAFLAACTPDCAGCLLLDVRMPGMSGLELHEKMASAGFELPVIFITGHGDVPMAVRALKRGAADFLEKPFDDAELADLVAAALERDARARAGRAERRSLAERIAALTPREREVMELVVAGKLNKIIADDLDISIKTVEVHRARIMEKLGVRSVAELVQLHLAANNGGRAA